VTLINEIRGSVIAYVSKDGPN